MKLSADHRCYPDFGMTFKLGDSQGGVTGMQNWNRYIWSSGEACAVGLAFARMMGTPQCRLFLPLFEPCVPLIDRVTAMRFIFSSSTSEIGKIWTAGPMR